MNSMTAPQKDRHPHPADQVEVTRGLTKVTRGFVTVLAGDDAIVGIGVVNGKLKEIRVPIRNLSIIGSAH